MLSPLDAGDRDRCEVREVMSPFNLALHDHLLSLGYEWQRVSEKDEPAYDEYIGLSEMVFMSEDGTAEYVDRCLEFEIFLISRALDDVTVH